MPIDNDGSIRHVRQHHGSGADQATLADGDMVSNRRADADERPVGNGYATGEADTRSEVTAPADAAVVPDHGAGSDDGGRPDRRQCVDHHAREDHRSGIDAVGIDHRRGIDEPGETMPGCKDPIGDAGTAAKASAEIGDADQPLGRTRILRGERFVEATYAIHSIGCLKERGIDGVAIDAPPAPQQEGAGERLGPWAGSCNKQAFHCGEPCRSR